MCAVLAVAAALTTASNCLGESVMPGSTGAQMTPARMPASRKLRSAPNRKSGRGARGSSIRASSASVVVTVRLTEILLRCAISISRSISRTTIADFVTIPSSSPECLAISCKIARVILSFRSIGCFRKISCSACAQNNLELRCYDNQVSRKIVPRSMAITRLLPMFRT